MRLMPQSALAVFVAGLLVLSHNFAFAQSVGGGFGGVGSGASGHGDVGAAPRPNWRESISPRDFESLRRERALSDVLIDGRSKNKALRDAAMQPFLIIRDPQTGEIIDLLRDVPLNDNSVIRPTLPQKPPRNPRAPHPPGTFRLLNPQRSADELVEAIGKENLSPALVADIAEAQESPCNQAFVDWSESLRQLDGIMLTSQLGVDRVAEHYDQAALDEYNDYSRTFDQSCLSNIRRLPQPLSDAGILDAYAIVFVGSVPYCGALRIRAQRLVTARHCFFDPADHQKLFDMSDVTVALVSQPNVFHKVTNIAFKEVEPSMFRAYDSTDDFLFLDVASLDPDMPPITWAPPDTGDKALILGYYRFHDTDWIFEKDRSDLNKKHWAEGLRWTSAPICHLKAPVNGCISHYCQTDRKFSGSPVFSYNAASGLVVHGIHIGGLSRSETCSAQLGDAASNLAIWIDEEAADQIQ